MGLKLQRITLTFIDGIFDGPSVEYTVAPTGTDIKPIGKCTIDGGTVERLKAVANELRQQINSAV